MAGAAIGRPPHINPSLSDTEDMSSAHIPGLETLALAIEANGSHRPGHLWRARLYAAELARRLEWDRARLEELELAAVLHDAGELAVPQTILAGSARLTPPELERMQAHAGVGALMAQRAGLPPAVAAMVRGHHERWDGGGYPDGLRRDAIPPGARILAVADCLAGRDAGAALQELRAGCGTAFDPQVVRVALESLHEMERSVKRAMASTPLPLFHGAIAASRREDRLLACLDTGLGSAGGLAETMSAFEDCLRDLIAYDCMAVFRRREHQLRARLPERRWVGGVVRAHHPLR